jgi:hypothetical protein
MPCISWSTIPPRCFSEEYLMYPDLYCHTKLIFFRINSFLFCCKIRKLFGKFPLKKLMFFWILLFFREWVDNIYLIRFGSCVFLSLDRQKSPNDLPLMCNKCFKCIYCFFKIFFVQRYCGFFSMDAFSYSFCEHYFWYVFWIFSFIGLWHIASKIRNAKLCKFVPLRCMDAPIVNTED